MARPRMAQAGGSRHEARPLRPQRRRIHWLVDPKRGTLRALRLEGERYRVEAELARRGSFVPALFPRLTVRMRDVLAP